MPEVPHRARHDPSICGAPGLFRSLVRGSRDTPLAITYGFGAETLRYESPALLGCDDLRVLQGVMTLATTGDVAIDADTENGSLRTLRSSLALHGDVTDASVLLVQTSLAKLALVAGYAERGGALSRHLRASLTRLAACRVACVSETATNEWRLLSWDELATGRNRLRIALNPRSSECALGLRRYTLINMDEARSLHDDVARLCHQRLSTWIDAAPKRQPDATTERKRVRLSTLWDYAWADATHKPSAAAARQRRVTLRTAIKAIRALGWRVDEDDVGGDTYSLSRPLKTAA